MLLPFATMCIPRFLASGQEESMRPSPGTGRRSRASAVRAWPIWGLAPWLKTYIIVI